MSSASLGLGRPQSNLKAASKHPRQRSSSAYQVFDAAQVQTFKEAFSLIDQDNDGVISEADLRGLLNSLAGQLNFTSFVTLMASHLSALDPESEMLEAFACFDEDNSGYCDAGEVREWLKSSGDRMSDEEVDKLLHPPFLDRKTGKFNYRLFCQTLRIADTGDEEAA
ncbi:hypothetical protein JCM10450v2_002869 [Rhodotorula kratochvilovae]